MKRSSPQKAFNQSRYCPHCKKAKQACICSKIQPIRCKTELILLQHPNEAKHPKGSAIILPLSLNQGERTRVHHLIGEDFSAHVQLQQLLDESDVKHCILYPSPESQSLSDWLIQLPPHHVLHPQENIGLQSLIETKIRLILIDATWKKAYKIWQLSKNLHELDCVHLPKSIHGQYEIRKSPSPQHLSTLEAGFYSLMMIEPETDFAPLKQVFDFMIARQQSFRPS